MFFRKKKEEKLEYYFDYAAKTPPREEVVHTVSTYQKDFFHNPSSLHTPGQQVRREIDRAREVVAASLSANPKEIIFTSGGTESDTLAIQGVIRAARKKGVKKPHVVVGAIEHAAVLETAFQLKEDGLIELDILPVDKRGLLEIEDLKKIITKDTVLVSCMVVNNEVGVVQNIASIAKEVRRLKKKIHEDRHATYPLVHTDASQAVLLQELDVRKLGVDLLSFGGSKVYGPAGIGVLYVKTGSPIQSPWYGEGQEFGLRPGTEPAPLIAGLAKAIELAVLEREESKKSFKEIKEYFIELLEKFREDELLASLGFEMKIHGKEEWHSDHMVYVLVKGLESDQLVIELDARHVYTSAKSACKTFDPQTSHVLRALGYNDNSWGGVRFSFGKDTTKTDIEAAVVAYKEALVKLLHTKKEFNL